MKPVATEGGPAQNNVNTNLPYRTGNPSPFLPAKPKLHWDYVLDEMQWMAIDFRQELRLKIAQSKVYIMYVIITLYNTLHT